MTTNDEISEAVRAWARGMYTTEAAVELLIRGGKAIYARAPWLIKLGEGRIGLDFDKLYDEAGAWSGGEKALVSIALALVDPENPVQLGDEVARLDRRDVELVLAAIAHTSGSHEHGGIAYDETGRPSLIRHETLYPWPTRD